MRLAEFLPGRITIRRGTFVDYRQLAHFHYAPGAPATWAGLWAVEYRPSGRRDNNRRVQIDDRPSAMGCSPRVVAVAVLSYPTPALLVRETALGLHGPRYGQKLSFLNQHLRTISRVIVHPQFRGLGLARALVRRVLEDCPVRYVEAVAVMGAVNPFFERAGMMRINAPVDDAPAYYLFDRRVRRHVAPTRSPCR